MVIPQAIRYMFLEFRRENRGDGKCPVVTDTKRLEKMIENTVRRKGGRKKPRKTWK